MGGGNSEGDCRAPYCNQWGVYCVARGLFQNYFGLGSLVIITMSRPSVTVLRFLRAPFRPSCIFDRFCPVTTRRRGMKDVVR